MKTIKSRLYEVSVVTILLTIFVAARAHTTASAQCLDPDYPVDCEYFCCPLAYPVCGDYYCCPSAAPIYCEYGLLQWCCPSTLPVCGSNYDCYAQPVSTTTSTVEGGIIGSPCASPSDCGQGTECYTGNSFPGGYCTKQCTGTADCGADNLCITFNQGTSEETSICLDGCTSTADCRSGYSCLNADGGTVCFTGGSGTTTTSSIVVSGSYMAAMNIAGDDQRSTESSGMLPGTSPSKVKPFMLYGKRAPIHLIRQDRFLPSPDKSLFDKTIAALQERARAKKIVVAPYSLGDQTSFWVKDDNDAAWRQVAATVQRESAHCFIFVDNVLNAISDTALDSYATEFEIMYQVLSDNIGSFSDRDGNGKIAILLYNINDSSSAETGWLSGYFWQKDYLNASDPDLGQIRSNEMDVIYIRGNEPAGWLPEYGNFADLTLPTLIHEYQHLVNFCIMYWEPQLAGGTGNSNATWINEMMSMAAETMYFKKKLSDNPAYTHAGMAPGGYLESRIGYYNNDSKGSIRNGHGLVYWDTNGDVYANYSLSYIFGQYLATHASNGQGIFKEILNYMLQNAVFDYRAVAGVAQQRIEGIGSWEDLLKNWAVANMLNMATGLYGYNSSFVLTPHGPTRSRVQMHNGGIVYRKIDGAWAPPAFAGPHITYFDFSSDGASSPTTPRRLCPAANVLGGNNAYLENLRAFRDRTLAQSAIGRRMTHIYYDNTDTMNTALERNPMLRSCARSVLEIIAPMMGKKEAY